MKNPSPQRGGPTPFGWFQIAIAFGWIASGLYEVLPIVDSFHATGPWWHSIIHVIVLTRVFRLFCCLIVVTYGWRLSPVFAHLLATVTGDPLVITEYAAVLAFIVGLLYLFIAWYRARASNLDVTKDSAFILGSNLSSFGLSLILGVSIGQARAKREISQQITTLKMANEELISYRDAALEKIHRLHLLIRRLPSPPKIPPDLNP